MLLERSRRDALNFLNTRYLLGKLPLLHTLIFIIEMALTATLVAKFNSAYAKRPIVTTMMTNAILGGVADTVAQGITAYRARRAVLPTTRDSREAISDGIELQDVNEKSERQDRELPPRTVIAAPPPFDFERLIRFMSYGFVMAPIQFKWFGFLNKTFPITPKSGTYPAFQRVTMDQLVFAPIGLCVFFTYMTVAEGGGRRQLTKKFQDVYVPTLRANYVLWPAVQAINFRLMPIQFQIPFVSSIGIAWTAYLSLTNSAEVAAENEQ